MQTLTPGMATASNSPAFEPLARPATRYPFVLGAAGAAPRYTMIESPVGELLLVGDGEALTGLYMFPGHRGAPQIGSDWRLDPTPFAEATAQLRAYFAGELFEFDLRLAPRGTDFQLQVWHALVGIPYGQTTTYGAIAARLGRTAASRAVGMANGRNPISIIVPCHRVIGSTGALTGYGGGLRTKKQLLTLEGWPRA